MPNLSKQLFKLNLVRITGEQKNNVGPLVSVALRENVEGPGDVRKLKVAEWFS